MPITDTTLFRSRDDILAEMLALLVSAIPDAYVGEDGNWNITFAVQAGQLENLYLANQLLLEDMFITTASYTALLRHGEQYQLAPKGGTVSTGTLTFDGGDGTYVPLGTEAAYDPGGGLDPVFFSTTQDGTLPAPGVPPSTTISDGGTGGTLAAGTYEYCFTFVTASGETLPGDPTNAVTVAANHIISAANLPVGGPGTTGRNLYRSLNGGPFQLVYQWPNNTATGVFADNGLAVQPGTPPTVSSANRITLTASAVDPGANGNVAAGAIAVLSDAPATLTSVINPVPFTGGSEPEDTEDFRTRLLSWIQNPQTGSPSDLEAIAESIDGVDTATVFPNTPTNGSVTVRISG